MTRVTSDGLRVLLLDSLRVFKCEGVGFYLVADNPRQQIGQPVSRENHPPVSNPARAKKVSHRKHRSRCDHRAVRSPIPRNPDSPAIPVSDLRRNLETLLGPRLEVAVRKFGELTPLKLLAVS
jgi:hypothetical protein